MTWRADGVGRTALATRQPVGLAGYCTLRFLLEFLRGSDLERIGRHSDARYAGLTAMQYVCLAAVGMVAMRLGTVARASRSR